MKPIAKACLAVATLLLASCGGGDEDADSRTAGGEILPGSTSDAMLPLDQLQSQGEAAAPSRTTDTGQEGDGQAPADAEQPAANDDAPAPSELDAQIAD